MQQILLDLFDDIPSFDNFMPLNNEIISGSLQLFNSQFTHIVGVLQSGKTHLLKAWVNLAKSQQKTAIYLNAKNLTEDFRDITTNFNFIAIDNIDKLNEPEQILLFDLFNKIKLNNYSNYLLTSSSINLESSKLRDDLKTRILSGLNLSLKALNDEELLKALQIYINKEGVSITNLELNYLINHYPRNIGVLINVIHKISQKALVEKRNITIPLIKQTIKSDTID